METMACRRAAAALALVLAPMVAAQGDPGPEGLTPDPDALEALLDPAGSLGALLEEEAEVAEQASPTVVTAARYSQRVDRTPSHVHVIDRETIDALAPRSIAEVLRLVPGFAVLRRQARGHEISAFGVGGQFSNKILVLVDGHRVTEPGFGFTAWTDLPVSVEDVRQIEVVLGPESTLYGSNAFAAVVNLLSYSGGDQPGQRIRVSAGNRGYRRATWSWRGAEGKSSTAATFEHEHQGGFGALVDAAGLPDASFTSGERMRRRMARLRHKTELGKGTQLDLHVAQVNGHQQHLPLAPATRTELDGDEEATWLSFDLDHHLSPDRGLLFRGSYARRNRNTTTSPLSHLGISETRLDSTLFDLELRYDTREGPWRLVTGAGMRRIASSGYLLQPGDDDAHSTSLFLQGEREFGDRWVLFAGARAVFQDLGDDEVSWKVAGLYRPRRNLGLRLSVGTSFRQPDLIAARLRSVTSVGAAPLSAPALSPAPNLQNEVAREFVQAGVERLWSWGTVKVDVYTARLERLVSLQTTGPQLFAFTPAPVAVAANPVMFMNAADPARVRGVTAYIERKLGALRAGLSLNLQDVSGIPVAADSPYAPSRVGALSLILPETGRRWGGSLVFSAVSATDVDANAITDGAPLQLPGYGTLDLALHRKVSPRTRVSLGVNNLLDQRHREMIYSLIGDAREQGVRVGREWQVAVRVDL